MAETFTGLKLQGDIGKFGKAEISDVAGCVELADGKVVSGSEWGNLILWEGGKIKCKCLCWTTQRERLCNATYMFPQIANNHAHTDNKHPHTRIANTYTRTQIVTCHTRTNRNLPHSRKSLPVTLTQIVICILTQLVICHALWVAR